MALTQTDFYYTVQNDVIQAGPHSRPSRFGVNSPDSTLAAAGEWRLWEDVPAQPGSYYRLQRGTATTNSGATPSRVERVDTWEAWTPQQIRDAKKAEMEQQVPIVSVTDEVRDNTIRAQVEQLELKRKTALEELAQTADESVADFDTDIRARAASEAEYAANLVAQETRNLTTHSEMIDSGNGGLYTSPEETEIRARIKTNAEVSRGERAGVQEPTIGAQRGDVALEDEVRAEASFYETTFDWNAQAYFMPQCVLNEIPAGVTVAQVFGMIYDAGNTYLTWVPFSQRADGKWESAVGTSYIAAAKTQSGNWRMAVAYQGTSAEYEITRRVHVIPPASTWSWVRWGGRTI